MKVLVILFSSVPAAIACSCFPQSVNDAFCQADWVSRVNVTCFDNPYKDETGLYDVIYSVDHIHFFKKPSNVSSLPSLVYTPSDGSTCGLNMEVGTEYLLSGVQRKSDGTLHVYLCGQVNNGDYIGVSEWWNISPIVRANITTFQC